MERMSLTDVPRRKRPRTAYHKLTKEIQRKTEKTIEGCSDDEVLMHLQEDGNVPQKVRSGTPPLLPCALDASLSTIVAMKETSMGSAIMPISSEPVNANSNSELTKHTTMLRSTQQSITESIVITNSLPLDVWQTVLTGELTTDGVPTMLVSDVLSSLSCFSIEDVAPFLPGTDHLGKPFIYTPNVRRRTV